MLKRPDPAEYYEYYGLYTGQVPEGDVLAILEREGERTAQLLSALSPQRADHRYAPDKWSIKEVLGHVIDAERVFGFRAVHFARRDPAPLPSMEQDDWARVSNAARRPLADLIAEFSAVRSSHITLFKGFDAEMWIARGVASGYEFSVRTIPYVLAGHEIHHRRVLEERYL